MSPSAQQHVEQLMEIMEHEKKTDSQATEDQEQVEGGEELFNPDIGRSVLGTILNTISNELEQECLDEVVELVNSCLICSWNPRLVPGNIWSIPGMPGTIFQVHQAWAP